MSDEINREEEKVEIPEQETAEPETAAAEETEAVQPEETAEPEEIPADKTEGEQKEEVPGKPEEEKTVGKKEKKFFRKSSKEEEKIAALEKEQAALNDRYLRVCAEYDNYRKRSQKEKDALYGDIKANVVSSFLPVYDNLERALNQGTEDEAYRKGVEMIMNQFCTTLEKLGITPIDCLGEKFDPSLHNAVMHVDDEEKGENEIVEVFQKGFKAGDKVIRFAMVKVAN